MAEGFRGLQKVAEDCGGCEGVAEGGRLALFPCRPTGVAGRAQERRGAGAATTPTPAG